MITIACPSCRATFQAPDGAIGPTGRTVRCSACGHQWHFTPPVVEPDLKSMIDRLATEGLDALPPAPVSSGSEPETFANILAETQDTPTADEPRTLFKSRPPAPPPTPIKPRPWVTGHGAVQGYAASLMVAAIICLGIVGGQKLITSLWPKTQAVYDGLGMPMVLGEPNLVFQDLKATWAKGEYTLTGTIHNQDSLQQMLPPIRVGVMGPGDIPITVWVFRADAKYIDPGAHIKFNHTRPFDQPGDVEQLIFSFIEDTSGG